MFMTTKHTNYEVVIVGGAMMGSAIAWFLANSPDFAGRVLVVERDPTYARAATTATNSCIRQQFSNAINVQMSMFGAEYINNFRTFMGDNPEVPTLRIHNFGYMYLARDPVFAAALVANQKVQASCGAVTRIMSPEEIGRAYPFYHLDDILVGSHNQVNEGYFDGGTLFDWWKRGARAKGVEYIADEVDGLDMGPGGVQAVRLKSGTAVACGSLVNAAGTRAAGLARMAGIDLPVEPRKRFTYVFSAARPLDRDLPLTIDPTGVHVRTDGAHYMAGTAPDDDQGVDPDDFTEDHGLWEDKVWPAIAHRIPQFEAIRLVRSWVGHYDYNTLDQNAVLGAHPDVANFIMVNGFSGHGLQHSPAVGRGIAELLTYGGYRSLDLTPFSYQRIIDNYPFLERAVI